MVIDPRASPRTRPSVSARSGSWAARWFVSSKPHRLAVPDFACPTQKAFVRTDVHGTELGPSRSGPQNKSPRGSYASVVSDPGIVAAQVEYYRARAPEYDEYYERTGPFDLGVDANLVWRGELDQVQSWLDTHVRVSVLDVAAGTGWWTERLARLADRVVALDAAPEMLAINRARNAGAGVTFVEGDVFAYQPRQRFDVVFFGFWLSHVPGDRFVEFWRLLSEWLAPGGRVLLVDNMESSAPWIQERPIGQPHSELMTRRLNDGRTFTIVKTHWTPDLLGRQLDDIGWATALNATSKYFVFGSARPPDD